MSIQIYRTQLYVNGNWQDEKQIEARAGYAAAHKAMMQHVIEDPTMCGAEWSIRVELEYTNGTKYWDKFKFEPSIVIDEVISE